VMPVEIGFSYTYSSYPYVMTDLQTEQKFWFGN